MAGWAKRILELGGNNALIVSTSADLDMAAHSIFFGAVGTAGQRCTSTRRVIVHESVADKLREQLLTAYKIVRIGNPLDGNDRWVRWLMRMRWRRCSIRSGS